MRPQIFVALGIALFCNSAHASAQTTTTTTTTTTIVRPLQPSFPALPPNFPNRSSTTFVRPNIVSPYPQPMQGTVPFYDPMRLILQNPMRALPGQPTQPNQTIVPYTSLGFANGQPQPQSPYGLGGTFLNNGSGSGFINNGNISGYNGGVIVTPGSLGSGGVGVTFGGGSQYFPPPQSPAQPYPQPYAGNPNFNNQNNANNRRNNVNRDRYGNRNNSNANNNGNTTNATVITGIGSSTIVTPSGVGVRNGGVVVSIPGNVWNWEYFQRGTVVFPGHQAVLVPNQTIFAPFGLSYGCAPYIRTTYIVTTPYAYGDGQENVVVQPFSDNDAYVAEDTERARALRAALNDMTYFWEENDLRALRRRISGIGSIAVFQNEQFAYSVDSTNFLGLAQDAMDRVQTTAFRFRRVVRRDDGLVNAYALHKYRARQADDTLVTRSATIRCTFAYANGDWYLSAISLTSDTVARQ